MTWFELVHWLEMMLQILGSQPTSQQRLPNFAGTWRVGEFRIGNEPAANQSEIIGGAPINCGKACTIAQSSETLAASRAPDKEGAKPGNDVVYLDGRTLPENATVNVRPDGNKLVLVRSFASITVTETLSIEKDRMVVDVAVGAARVGPYRLTYERK